MQRNGDFGDFLGDCKKFINSLGDIKILLYYKWNSTKVYRINLANSRATHATIILVTYMIIRNIVLLENIVYQSVFVQKPQKLLEFYRVPHVIIIHAVHLNLKNIKPPVNI